MKAITQLVQVAQPEILTSWNVGLLGYNIRCMECKGVYHKSLYTSLAHPLCPKCRNEFEAEELITKSVKSVEQAIREVREYLAYHKLRKRKKDKYIKLSKRIRERIKQDLS